MHAPTPGLSLAAGASGGSYTSSALAPAVATREVILSINVGAASPDLPVFRASVSVSTDGRRWSCGYGILAWGHRAPGPEPKSGPEGHIDVDTLKLKTAARYVKSRLAWKGCAEEALITRVALSLFEPEAAETSLTDSDRTAWGQTLAVPFLSQWDVPGHPAERICSPTSVAMVARYHGCPTEPADLAARSYDPHARVYGNWPLNMLAASRAGLRAYVDRGTTLRDLEVSVGGGMPVVTSIAYGEGELHGAHVPRSAGHLVVVAGFSDGGDVVVRDPAARGRNVWTEYDRDEFARAWLGHGGVLYRITPQTP